MVKTLEKAIAEVSRLPVADQEQIGRKLLVHVEKLNVLRGDIAGGGRGAAGDDPATRLKPCSHEVRSSTGFD